MNEIDWSKAPEGADKYNTHNSMFYKGERPDLQVFIHDQWKQSSIIQSNEHFVYRPTTPSWSGEGLPPVGVECEALWTSATGEYVRVVVVGYDHDQSYVVYRILAGVRAGEYESSRQVDVEGHPCLRLTRTPEQSAADEREAAIMEMTHVIYMKRCGLDCTPCSPADEVKVAASALYDAGYRKP